MGGCCVREKEKVEKTFCDSGVQYSPNILKNKVSKAQSTHARQISGGKNRLLLNGGEVSSSSSLANSQATEYDPNSARNSNAPLSSVRSNQTPKGNIKQTRFMQEGALTAKPIIVSKKISENTYFNHHNSGESGGEGQPLRNQMDYASGGQSNWKKLISDEGLEDQSERQKIYSDADSQQKRVQFEEDQPHEVKQGYDNQDQEEVECVEMTMGMEIDINNGGEREEKVKRSRNKKDLNAAQPDELTISQTVDLHSQLLSSLQFNDNFVKHARLSTQATTSSRTNGQLSSQDEISDRSASDGQKWPMQSQLVQVLQMQQSQQQQLSVKPRSRQNSKESMEREQIPKSEDPWELREKQNNMRLKMEESAQIDEEIKRIERKKMLKSFNQGMIPKNIYFDSVPRRSSGAGISGTSTLQRTGTSPNRSTLGASSIVLTQGLSATSDISGVRHSARARLTQSSFVQAAPTKSGLRERNIAVHSSELPNSIEDMPISLNIPENVLSQMEERKKLELAVVENLINKEQ